jgi:hypothetical protein
MRNLARPFLVGRGVRRAAQAQILKSPVNWFTPGSIRSPLLYAMVSNHELGKYHDAEEARRWASRNFVLGPILAAAVLLMTVAGLTLTPKLFVGNGGFDIERTADSSSVARPARKGFGEFHRVHGPI